MAIWSPAEDLHLFDGGPPRRLLGAWGRLDVAHQQAWRRAWIIAAVGWLPLLALALVSLLDGQDEVWRAFVRDASVHARSLVTAPLLVLAEAVCIPRLGAVARTFHERGVVPYSERRRYESMVASIRRLRDWWPIEVLAVVLAYVVALLIALHVPSTYLPDWHRGASQAPLGRSLASWWHSLVSLPILLILLQGWLWRLAVWTRYLWCVSRLDLRLVASHPEGAAGLMFVSFSLRAFSVIGLAIGAMVAATSLAHVLAGGEHSARSLGAELLGTVVFVVVLFAAPMLVFFTPLLRTWRMGVVSHGALAQRVGEAFEDKWVGEQVDVVALEPLSTGDFSAVTDLFQTMDRAYAMRLTPIDLHSLAALAGVTAVPFAIVALALVPFDELLARLLKFFL